MLLPVVAAVASVCAAVPSLLVAGGGAAAGVPDYAVCPCVRRGVHGTCQCVCEAAAAEAASVAAVAASAAAWWVEAPRCVAELLHIGVHVGEVSANHTRVAG